MCTLHALTTWFEVKVGNKMNFTSPPLRGPDQQAHLLPYYVLSSSKHTQCADAGGPFWMHYSQNRENVPFLLYSFGKST